jgi:branched-chain amino acid transport system substrate-binding protein
MRSLRISALLLALLLLITACTGAQVTEGDDAADAGTEPADEPADEPAEETAEPAETDADTILIGSIHPLTGALALDGNQMDNAVQMAVDGINAEGGIQSLGGAQLEVLSADSQGEPDVGQTEAQRMIDQGVITLVGAFQSAVTINIANLAERSQVPLVIDVAVADEIIQEGSQFTFRIQPNSSAMGANAAQYLAEFAEQSGEDISTVAYLHQEDAFGTSVFTAFREEAEGLGMEIVEEIPYNAFEVSDLTTEMARVDASGADVLVNTGYYNDGVLVGRDALASQPGVKAIMGVAQAAFDEPQFPEDVPDGAEHVLGSNYHWDATSDRVVQLREDFEAEFGEPMRTAAVFSYQAVEVIADALERAGSAEPGDVRDALSETSFEDPLLAFAGPIEFDERGENVNAIPIVMQVQDGVPRQVWPEQFAEVDLVFPALPWEQ